MIHRGGWLGAPIMIRNTWAVPVGIPPGAYTRREHRLRTRSGGLKLRSGAGQFDRPTGNWPSDELFPSTYTP